MSDKPFKVNVEDTVLHVADVIIKNKLKIIPVVDNKNRLVGIIRRIGLLSQAARGELIQEND
jgi:Mg/Co/Ni transporter MgtE